MKTFIVSQQPSKKPGDTLGDTTRLHVRQLTTCLFMSFLMSTEPKNKSRCNQPTSCRSFTSHLEETQGQIERIDQLVEKAGLKLKRKRLVKSSGQSKWSKYDQISRKSDSPVCIFGY